MPPPPLRIVVLTGVPGVGKTETARRLIEWFPARSALLDTDAFASLHPWQVDDDFHAIVGENLRACVENYRRWGASRLLISGVIVPGGIYAELKPLLDDPAYDWSVYGLVATPDTIRRRLRSDPKSQDAEQRLRWLHLDDEVRKVPGVVVVETDERSLDQVAAHVAHMEGLLGADEAAALGPRDAPRSAEVRLPLDEVRAVCQRVLRGVGAPASVASSVSDDLIASEREGYRSHGLLRLPEYVAAIGRGEILPDRRPEVTWLSRRTARVDGNRGFGTLAAAAVQHTLSEALATEEVAVVGLSNSNHLGRLAHIADGLCREGHLVVGFVNYLGAGQKMPPWRGAEARFCTNPLVFGFPTRTGDPVLIDLSSSAVAEGKVRAAALSGHSVPEGWLIDDEWHPVRDPRRLYASPPTAFLAPLGGNRTGYKGYALALAVEILAGVLTGAGFVQEGVSTGGNGGTFIAMRPSVLGREPEAFLADLDALLDYCRGCPPAPGSEPVRIPGLSSPPSETALAINASLWARITRSLPAQA